MTNQLRKTNGQKLIDETVKQAIEKFRLSNRESDILRLLVSGTVSAEAAAKELGISQNTVRIHIKNINTKLGVRSKSEILSKIIQMIANPI